MTTTPTLLDVALAAYDAGLCVWPPREDGTKRPDGRWKQYQHQRPSRPVIERLYANGRQGIGILTGAISGNLEMLEFEGRAQNEWRAFVKLCRDDPIANIAFEHICAGYAERTPTNGVHLLYRCDTIEGNRKLARRSATADELAANPDEPIKVLIETRGEGGYVIVAPSAGTVHPTGQPWHLRTGGFDSIATITPEERTRLFEICATFDEPNHETNTIPHPTDELWATFTPAGERWIDDTIELYNQRTTWDDVLIGWTRLHTRDGITYWVRPGKNPRDGHSATTNALGTDRLIIFSSSVDGFDTYTGQGKATSYDRFSAYAILHHHGDRIAAARTVRDLNSPLITTNTTTASVVSSPYTPIDWPAFWRRERAGEDWLINPIAPRARQVAMWATHKTGKSLITLEGAAGAATGRPVFGNPPTTPIHVIYLDMEMTEDDLHDRLTEMGYGPDIDLSHFHYYLLPALPPLDTPEGGQAVIALAEQHHAELVVIDTMARVVRGEENSADTYRAFYRYTGLHLKAREIALLRLDHAGKDPTRGQRGSSSKGDDVDVVYQLSRVDNGFKIARKAARMSWVPEEVILDVHDEPHLHHTLANVGTPLGTQAKIAELDLLDIPIEWSERKVATRLREAGVMVGKGTILRAAINTRRARQHTQNEVALTAWMTPENGLKDS